MSGARGSCGSSDLCAHVCRFLLLPGALAPSTQLACLDVGAAGGPGVLSCSRLDHWRRGMLAVLKHLNSFCKREKEHFEGLVPSGGRVWLAVHLGIPSASLEPGMVGTGKQTRWQNSWILSAQSEEALLQAWLLRGRRGRLRKQHAAHLSARFGDRQTWGPIGQGILGRRPLERLRVGVRPRMLDPWC